MLTGQTCWQISQPKMRLPIKGRSSMGMLPRSSMVRNEMQARGIKLVGIGKRLGWTGVQADLTIAATALRGVSGSKGMLVTISARKIHEPHAFVRILVFLPYQPSPARLCHGTIDHAPGIHKEAGLDCLRHLAVCVLLQPARETL